VTLFGKVSRRLETYESELGTKQSCEIKIIHFVEKLYFNPGLSGEEDTIRDQVPVLQKPSFFVNKRQQAWLSSDYSPKRAALKRKK
jgi:hypothetical protein